MDERRREDPSRPGHVPQREAPGEEQPHKRELRPRRELTEYEPAPPAEPDPEPE